MEQTKMEGSLHKMEGSSHGNKNAGSFAAASQSGDGDSVTGSLTRGKDAVGAAAADDMDSAGSDLKALRNDMNNLKDTVTKFVSQAGSEAAKSAREITSNVGGLVVVVSIMRRNSGRRSSVADTPGST